MLSKLSAYGVLLLLFLMIVTVFFHDISLDTHTSSLEHMPDFMFETVTISHYNNGELEFELEADSALIDKDTDQLEATRVDGKVLLHDRLDFIRFNAQTARYYLDAHTMRLKKPYLVYVGLSQPDPDPLWLDSEWLQWTMSTGIIESMAESRLFHRAAIVRTRFLRFNITTKELTLDRSPYIGLRVHHET